MAFFSVTIFSHWLRVVALAFAPLIPVLRELRMLRVVFLIAQPTSPRRGGENSPTHNLSNTLQRAWVSILSERHAAPRLKIAELRQ
jgi:hypothetical protein